MNGEEPKRHEVTWCQREEAHRAIEKIAGRIQSQVRVIVEGRGGVNLKWPDAAQVIPPSPASPAGEGRGEGA